MFWKARHEEAVSELKGIRKLTLDSRGELRELRAELADVKKVVDENRTDIKALRGSMLSNMGDEISGWKGFRGIFIIGSTVWRMYFRHVWRILMVSFFGWLFLKFNRILSAIHVWSGGQ